MKAIIIIPCFNDNDSLHTLLENIALHCKLDILIVDDGSRTKVAVSFDFNNIEIIHNDTNRGKGYSLMKGFNHAINK